MSWRSAEGSCNHLRRPALEEIGARTALLWLDGIKGQERAYVEWLLAQYSKLEATEILTEEAVERSATGLSTPLQIEQYLTLAFEAGER